VIMDLSDRMRSTTVTITHDMESAYRIADRIGMLHAGKLIALGTPEELRRWPDPRVQQFIRGEARGPLSDEVPIERATDGETR